MGYTAVGVIGHDLLPEQHGWVKGELEKFIDEFTEKMTQGGGKVLWQVGLNPGSEVMAVNLLLKRGAPVTGVAAGPWMSDMFTGQLASGWRHVVKNLQSAGNHVLYQSKSLPNGISPSAREKLYLMSLLRRNESFASLCDVGVIVSSVFEGITQHAFGAFQQAKTPTGLIDAKPVFHIDPQKRVSQWLNVARDVDAGDSREV